MSKKTRCRVLSLLLALVMVLGMVPMASASSAYNVKLTETTPDASKLSTTIQQNKYKLLNGEEAYADNDTVRAIVIFEGGRSFACGTEQKQCCNAERCRSCSEVPRFAAQPHQDRNQAGGGQL